MNVTIYRHQEYNKYLVTIENGFNITQYTLYDMTISELGAFIKELTEGKEND